VEFKRKIYKPKRMAHNAERELKTNHIFAF